MALQLASMLEDVATRDDWTASVLKSMNSALDSFSVSPGYNLMVTIAGRSYVFCSDGKGKLQVSMPGPGKQTMNALSKAAVRIVLDFDAFKDYDSTARTWADDMVLKRKIRFEGDTALLEKFESDLGHKISSVQSSVDAGGPGKNAIATARAEVLDAFEGVKSQDKDSWELELAGVSGELALAEYQVDGTPEFMGYWGWLQFSALSSMMGNMGQGNYCAANNLLDVMSFNARMTFRPNDMPCTMMWGAVTGIGMRWKAFASQDFLAKDENFAAMLIYYNEAQTGLGYILRGFAPEWVSVALFDPQTLAFIKSKEVVRHPDPWGFAKGKGLGRGGGLSFDNEDSSLDVYEKNSQQVESDEWLIPGRRVEICGLLKSPDLNGMKCTLVEEVDDEKWQVRLDGDLGDKLIKVANMKSFHNKPITAEDHSTKEFSLAGTFTEWMPMDMHWDSEAKCHMLEFNIDKLKCPAGFDIAKGKAAPIAWKKRTAQWKITEPGKYQVKSFCKDGGRFQRIDITRVGEVEVPVPEEGLRLREMLRNARPSWTDKELASVQEKLAKVEITTVSDFLEAIKPKKSGGLGDRLKEVGEKAFSGETMKAFREYAKCSV
mmetsp:Transcript_141338/g.260468  ORF Transcript_141338/g.260468 Transcript_141338/m.260468 type:complete len:603 (-) Transcript_141338:120-1928(-)